MKLLMEDGNTDDMDPRQEIGKVDTSLRPEL